MKDGDAVLLPYGYHPVSAPPGYKLYYLWAMAGVERKIGLHEDPTHTWIHELTVVAEIERLGVVAVIRMKDPAKLRAVFDALAEGGRARD